MKRFESSITSSTGRSTRRCRYALALPAWLIHDDFGMIALGLLSPKGGDEADIPGLRFCAISRLHAVLGEVRFTPASRHGSAGQHHDQDGIRPPGECGDAPMPNADLGASPRGSKDAFVTRVRIATLGIIGTCEAGPT
jgi:hypothetical protein